MALSKLELDERIRVAIGDEAYKYSEAPHHLKQLIRDCIEAVTPEPLQFSTNDTYENGERPYATEVYNHAIDTIEANTKELLD